MSALRPVHSYLKSCMQRTKINSKNKLQKISFVWGSTRVYTWVSNIDIASYADDNTPYTTENSIEEVIQN